MVRSDVIIASSTSGLLPSEMQMDLSHPERLVVSHPFNPVYLLPLVEVCGGSKTSEGSKQLAAALFESIGMHPLVLDVEVPGFVSDRLLEALWREGLHLVNDGVATTGQVDEAICYGPGLRWSFMGSFLTYYLAGGKGGMPHFMSQFGPALKAPWTKLVAPELTEDLLDKIVDQTNVQAGNWQLSELERLRDRCLISALQGLQKHNYASGSVLNAYVKKLGEANGETNGTEPPQKKTRTE